MDIDVIVAAIYIAVNASCLVAVSWLMWVPELPKVDVSCVHFGYRQELWKEEWEAIWDDPRHRLYG